MPLSKERDRERKKLERQAHVQPKYEQGFLYPDGRVRLEDMSVVQPKQCHQVKLYKPQSYVQPKKEQERYT